MIRLRRLTPTCRSRCFGDDLRHRLPDPDPGVVDQHVEAAIAVAVGGDNPDDAVLIGHVRRHRGDFDTRASELLGGRLQLVGRRAEMVSA